MPKWRIIGFRSASETGFDRIVSGSEKQVRTLLERLAARHLTDDEITDATLESRAHFEINRDKHPAKPMRLSTTGTDQHYVAIEVSDAPRS